MPTEQVKLLKLSSGRDLREISSNPGQSVFNTYGKKTDSQYLGDAMVFPSQDEYQEEKFAQVQPNLDKMGNGLAKLALGTIAVTGQGIGSLYGIGSALYHNDITKLSENAVSDPWNRLKDYVDEEYVQYATTEEKNSLTRFIPFGKGSSSVYFGSLADGAAFILGSYIPGIGAGKLVGAITNATSKGLMASAKAAGYIDEVGRATAGAEALAYRTLTNSEIPAIALNSKNFASKMAKASGVLSKSEAGIVDIATDILAAHNEATIEANEGRKKFVNDRIDEIISKTGVVPTDAELDRIEEDSKDLYTKRYGLNLAIVSASNISQFGNAFKTRTQNTIERFNKIKDTLKKGADDVYSYEAPKISKYIAWLKNPLTEKFEEGAQFTVEKALDKYYTDRYYNPNKADLGAAILYGIGETFGTTEGWDNMMTGFILGFVGGGGIRSATKEERGDSKSLLSRIKFDLGETGFGKPYAEAKEQAKDAAKLVDFLNKRNEHLSILFNGIASNKASEEKIVKLLKESNPLELQKKLKDEEYGQLMTTILTAYETGQSQWLLDSIKEQAAKYTKDEAGIDEYKQRYGVPGQNLDPNKSDQIVIGERASKISTIIKKVESHYKDIDVLFPNISDNQKRDYIFTLMTSEDSKRRLLSVYDDIKTLTGGLIDPMAIRMVNNPGEYHSALKKAYKDNEDALMKGLSNLDIKKLTIQLNDAFHLEQQYEVYKNASDAIVNIGKDYEEQIHKKYGETYLKNYERIHEVSRIREIGDREVTRDGEKTSMMNIYLNHAGSTMTGDDGVKYKFKKDDKGVYDPHIIVNENGEEQDAANFFDEDYVPEVEPVFTEEEGQEKTPEQKQIEDLEKTKKTKKVKIVNVTTEELLKWTNETIPKIVKEANDAIKELNTLFDNIHAGGVRKESISSALGNITVDKDGNILNYEEVIEALGSAEENFQAIKENIIRTFNITDELRKSLYKDLLEATVKNPLYYAFLDVTYKETLNDLEDLKQGTDFVQSIIDSIEAIKKSLADMEPEVELKRKVKAYKDLIKDNRQFRFQKTSVQKYINYNNIALADIKFTSEVMTDNIDRIVAYNNNIGILSKKNGYYVISILDSDDIIEITEDTYEGNISDLGITPVIVNEVTIANAKDIIPVVERIEKGEVIIKDSFANFLNVKLSKDKKYVYVSGHQFLFESNLFYNEQGSLINNKFQPAAPELIDVDGNRVQVAQPIIDILKMQYLVESIFNNVEVKVSLKIGDKNFTVIYNDKKHITTYKGKLYELRVKPIYNKDGFAGLSEISLLDNKTQDIIFLDENKDSEYIEMLNNAYIEYDRQQEELLELFEKHLNLNDEVTSPTTTLQSIESFKASGSFRSFDKSQTRNPEEIERELLPTFRYTDKERGLLETAIRSNIFYLDKFVKKINNLTEGAEKAKLTYADPTVIDNKFKFYTVNPKHDILDIPYILSGNDDGATLESKAYFFFTNLYNVKKETIIINNEEIEVEAIAVTEKTIPDSLKGKLTFINGKRGVDDIDIKAVIIKKRATPDSPIEPIIIEETLIFTSLPFYSLEKDKDGNYATVGFKNKEKHGERFHMNMWEYEKEFQDLSSIPSLTEEEQSRLALLTNQRNDIIKANIEKIIAIREEVLSNDKPTKLFLPGKTSGSVRDSEGSSPTLNTIANSFFSEKEKEDLSSLTEEYDPKNAKQKELLDRFKFYVGNESQTTSVNGSLLTLFNGNIIVGDKERQNVLNVANRKLHLNEAEDLYNIIDRLSKANLSGVKIDNKLGIVYIDKTKVDLNYAGGFYVWNFGHNSESFEKFQFGIFVEDDGTVNIKTDGVTHSYSSSDVEKKSAEILKLLLTFRRAYDKDGLTGEITRRKKGNFYAATIMNGKVRKFLSADEYKYHIMFETVKKYPLMSVFAKPFVSHLSSFHNEKQFYNKNLFFSIKSKEEVKDIHKKRLADAKEKVESNTTTEGTSTIASNPPISKDTNKTVKFIHDKLDPIMKDFFDGKHTPESLKEAFKDITPLLTVDMVDNHVFPKNSKYDFFRRTLKVMANSPDPDLYEVLMPDYDFNHEDKFDIDQNQDYYADLFNIEYLKENDRDVEGSVNRRARRNQAEQIAGRLVTDPKEIEQIIEKYEAEQEEKEGAIGESVEPDIDGKDEEETTVTTDTKEDIVEAKKADIERRRQANDTLGKSILQKLGYKNENRLPNGNVKGGQSGWKIRFNIKNPKTGDSYYADGKSTLVDAEYNKRAETLINFLLDYFGSNQKADSKNLQKHYVLEDKDGLKREPFKHLSGGEIGESDFTIYIGSADDVMKFISDIRIKHPEILELLHAGNKSEDVAIDDIFKGRIEGSKIGFSGYHAPTNLNKVTGSNDFTFNFNQDRVNINYNGTSLSDITIIVESSDKGYKGVFDENLKKDFPELYKNIRNIVGFQLYGDYLQGSNDEFLKLTGVDKINAKYDAELAALDQSAKETTKAGSVGVGGDVEAIKKELEIERDNKLAEIKDENIPENKKTELDKQISDKQKKQTELDKKIADTEKQVDDTIQNLDKASKEHNELADQILVDEPLTNQEKEIANSEKADGDTVEQHIKKSFRQYLKGLYNGGLVNFFKKIKDKLRKALLIVNMSAIMIAHNTGNFSFNQYVDLAKNYSERHIEVKPDSQLQTVTLKVSDNKLEDNTGVNKIPYKSGYATNQVINLEGNTFEARNRDDKTAVQNAVGITTNLFKPFQEVANFKGVLPRNSDTVKQNPPVIAFNKKTGNVKAGNLKDFNDDWLVSETFTIPLDFKTDANGQVRTVYHNQAERNVPVTTVNRKDVPFPIGLDTKDKTIDPTKHNTFGVLEGGKVILSVGNYQVQVNGGFADIYSAWEELKAKNPNKEITAYLLDNGSYNLPILKDDGVVTSEDLTKHTLRNKDGGTSLVLKQKIPQGAANYPHGYQKIETNNFRKDSTGNKVENKPTAIVLHHTGEYKGGEKDVIKEFTAPKGNSSHYLIGKDGKIYQFNDGSYVMYHAGESLFKEKEDLNSSSLGIEIQGDSENSGDFTKEQYESLITLVYHLAKNYNIPIENIVDHKTIRNNYLKAHPEDKVTKEKIDLNDMVMKRIVKELQKAYPKIEQQQREQHDTTTEKGKSEMPISTPLEVLGALQGLDLAIRAYRRRKANKASEKNIEPDQPNVATITKRLIDNPIKEVALSRIEDLQKSLDSQKAELEDLRKDKSVNQSDIDNFQKQIDELTAKSNEVLSKNNENKNARDKIKTEYADKIKAVEQSLKETTKAGIDNLDKSDVSNQSSQVEPDSDTTEEEKSFGTGKSKYKKSKIKTNNPDFTALEMSDNAYHFAKFPQITDINTELDNIQTMLGLSDDEKSRLAAIVYNNSEGLFMSNGDILLKQTGVIGRGYHEAFHKVFRMYMTDAESNYLINLVKKKYPNYTDIQAEERLAEEFRYYMLTGKVNPELTETKGFLEAILAFLEKLFGFGLENKFNKIKKGGFSTLIPVTNRFTNIHYAVKMEGEEIPEFRDSLSDEQQIDEMSDLALSKIENYLTTDIISFSKDIDKEFIKKLIIDAFNDEEFKKTRYGIESSDDLKSDKLFIKDLYNEIVRKLQNVSSLDLEKEEEEEGTVTKDKSTNAYLDAHERDFKSSVPKPVKLLLLSIKDQKRTNLIGLPKPISVPQMIRDLVNGFANMSGEADITAYLREKAKKDFRYAALLERLSLDKPNLDPKGALNRNNLKQKFFSFLTKTKHDMIGYRYDENGNLKQIRLQDEQIVKDAKSRWLLNLRRLNRDEGGFLDVTKIPDKGDRSTYDMSPKRAREFADYLGITLHEEMWKSKKTLTDLYTVHSSLTASLKSSVKMRSLDSIYNTVYGDEGTSHLHMALKALALANAKFETDVVSNSLTSATGSIIYNVTPQSSLTHAVAETVAKKPSNVYAASAQFTPVKETPSTPNMGMLRPLDGGTGEEIKELSPVDYIKIYFEDALNNVFHFFTAGGSNFENAIRYNTNNENGSTGFNKIPESTEELALYISRKFIPAELAYLYDLSTKSVNGYIDNTKKVKLSDKYQSIPDVETFTEKSIFYKYIAHLANERVNKGDTGAYANEKTIQKDLDAFIKTSIEIIRKQGLSEKEMSDGELIMAFSKQMAINLDISKSVFGSLSVYGEDPYKFFKRVSMANGPKEYFTPDVEFLTRFLPRNDNKRNEDRANLAFLVISEAQKQSLPDNIIEHLKESMGEKSANKYKTTEYADGTVIVKLDGYRDLMATWGEWGDRDEANYYRELDEEDVNETSSNFAYVNSQKGQFFANNFDGVPYSNKSAVMPTVPSQFEKGDIGFHILELLDKYNLDGIMLPSTVKNNALRKEAHHDLFIETTNPDTGQIDITVNTDVKEVSIVQLPLKDFGRQVVTDVKDATKTTYSVQMNKNLISGLYEEGQIAVKSWHSFNILEDSAVAISSEEEAKAYVSNLINNLNESTEKQLEIRYFALLKKLGLKDVNGVISANEEDFKNLKKTLLEAATNNGVSANIINNINNTFSDESLAKYEFVMAREVIEHLLNSTVRRNLIERKINGKQAILGTSLMYKNLRKFTQEDLDNGLEALSPYRPNEEGKYTEPLEVYLPHHFREKFGIGTEVDLDNVDPRLLRILATRIPNQAQSSIESIRIKGFLPQSMLDIVITPAVMVTKSGHDFDVDKLNLYFFNSYVNDGIHVPFVRTQDPVLIVKQLLASKTTKDAFRARDLENSEKLETYLTQIKEAKSRLWTYGNKLFETKKKLYELSEETKAIIAANPSANIDSKYAIKNELDSEIERLTPITENLQQLVAEGNEFIINFINQLPENLRTPLEVYENEMLNIQHEIFLNETNFDEMLIPNSQDSINDAAKKHGKMHENNITESKWGYLRHIGPLNHILYALTNREAADLIAIAAKATVSHSQSQLIGIKLKRPLNILSKYTNGTSFSSRYVKTSTGEKSKLTISDFIQQVLSGVVDAEKGDAIIRVNLNKITINTYLLLLQNGVHPENIFDLINNKHYLDSIALWKSENTGKSYSAYLKSSITEIKNQEPLNFARIDRYTDKEILNYIVGFNEYQSEQISLNKFLSPDTVNFNNQNDVYYFIEDFDEFVETSKMFDTEALSKIETDITVSSFYKYIREWNKINDKFSLFSEEDYGSVTVRKLKDYIKDKLKYKNAKARTLAYKKVDTSLITAILQNFGRAPINRIEELFKGNNSLPMRFYEEIKSNEKLVAYFGVLSSDMKDNLALLTVRPSIEEVNEIANLLHNIFFNGVKGAKLFYDTLDFLIVQGGIQRSPINFIDYLPSTYTLDNTIKSIEDYSNDPDGLLATFIPNFFLNNANDNYLVPILNGDRGVPQGTWAYKTEKDAEAIYVSINQDNQFIKLPVRNDRIYSREYWMDIYQRPVLRNTDNIKEDIVKPTTKSTPTQKVIEQPIQNKEGRTIAIIGTAGRSQVPTVAEWNNMLKDAESRVNPNDTLISGGAAFADHIAVKLFLEGKVKSLKLRLPAKIVNNQFVGGYGTAGGTANYYHKPFSKLLGVDTIAEIQQAIDKGAEVTYETETSNKAMFIRNEKVAKESNAMIAYTYGESNEPADGGTKDTWNKSKYSDKTHVPISKIKFVEQPINKEIKLNEIYNQLRNKTQSENVVIKSWGELKDVTEAITPQGIVSTRIKNSNEHFGNPFSHDPAGKTQGLIKTETIKEAVEKYIDWLITDKYDFDHPLKPMEDKEFNKLYEEIKKMSGSTNKNIQERFALNLLLDLLNRKKWIKTQIQSGELKGKPILYYKELGEPSHATALDYLINKYDWNKNQPTEIKPKIDSSKKIENLKRGDIINFQQQEFLVERVKNEGIDVRDVNTGDVDFISTEDYINETQEQPIQNKEGVDFVFEQYPELAKIGSKEQYSQYLKTLNRLKVQDLKTKVAEKWDTIKSVSEDLRNYISNQFAEKHNLTQEQIDILKEFVNIGEEDISSNPFVYFEDFEDRPDLIKKYNLRELTTKERLNQWKRFEYKFPNVTQKEILKLGQIEDISGYIAREQKGALLSEIEGKSGLPDNMANLFRGNSDIEGFKEFVSGEPITKKTISKKINDIDNYKGTGISKEEWNMLSTKEKEVLLWQKKNCK